MRGLGALNNTPAFFSSLINLLFLQDLPDLNCRIATLSLKGKVDNSYSLNLSIL